MDGVAFSGGDTQGMGADLTIGSGSYIDDFEEQLIGHYVGETVEVNVTFPENYGSEDFNGKDATFEVVINGIYQ
jgi:trigger factor